MRSLFYITFLLFFTQPIHADTKFLTISDIHYGAQNPTGDGVDTGKQLWAVTLQKFSELANEVDFIITLGDFPTHSLLNNSYKEDYERTIFRGLYQGDKLAKPMFYVTGNNDSLQGNYKAFRWNNKSPITLTKEWNSTCIHCEGLIVDKTHMYEGGYYASYVIPGNRDIMLIALNSSQFAVQHFWGPNYPNQNSDARTQLQWLKEQLQTHQAKQLLLAMHIQPGTNNKGKPLWQKENLAQFIALLKIAAPRYQQITLLTAHSHMDDIRKIRVNDHLNIYAFNTPGISRIHHNYPGMKIFTLNEQLQLKNYTTFYTTRDEHWENEQYQATGDNSSVFPQCKGIENIASCLNTLNEQAVCTSLQKGLFYGVKNPGVDSSVCKLTYPIE